MADDVQKEEAPPVDFEVAELTSELEEVSGGSCASSGCTQCKEPPPVG